MQSVQHASDGGEPRAHFPSALRSTEPTLQKEFVVRLSVNPNARLLSLAPLDEAIIIVEKQS